MTRFAPLLIGLAALGASAAATAAPAHLDAVIVRTRFGIPHVKAADYASLGYGAGYAFAEDNVCLLADDVVTVTGERSKYFGPGAKTVVSFAETRNLDSDAFFKTVLDGPTLLAAFEKTSPEYQASVRGYVAGYNHYLKTRGSSGLPLPCRGASWVRPITLEDHLKLTAEKMIQAGAAAWLPYIVDAAPPGAPAATAAAEAVDPDRRHGPRQQRLGFRAGGDRRSWRPSGQPALSLADHQPLLPDSPDHPRQAGCDGCGLVGPAGRGHRFQQGCRLDAHCLDRSALLAVRA
jgi:acyl-homoserine lactone acylase PvdQ